MAAAADRHAVGVDRAERLARVLDDRQAEPLERREVGGVAEDVHRQQRRRALRDRRRGGVRVEVQRHRVDVGEHGPRALVHGHVGAGHERERARDDLVAVADAGRAQRQVQPGGAARDRAARTARRRARRTPARTRASSGPSDRRPRPQHLEHALAPRARRSPAARAGWPRSRLTCPSQSRACAEAAWSGDRLRRDPHPVLERVDQRLPGRLDDVLRDPDRAPHLRRRRRRRAAPA